MRLSFVDHMDNTCSILNDYKSRIDGAIADCQNAVNLIPVRRSIFFLSFSSSSNCSVGSFFFHTVFLVFSLFKCTSIMTNRTHWWLICSSIEDIRRTDVLILSRQLIEHEEAALPSEIRVCSLYVYIITSKDQIFSCNLDNKQQTLKG